jgi:hypothetical protein
MGFSSMSCRPLMHLIHSLVLVMLVDWNLPWRRTLSAFQQILLLLQQQLEVQILPNFTTRLVVVDKPRNHAAVTNTLVRKQQQQRLLVRHQVAVVKFVEEHAVHRHPHLVMVIDIVVAASQGHLLPPPLGERLQYNCSTTTTTTKQLPAQ